MTDIGGGIPSVVVVANPHDAAELEAMLDSVGFAAVWSGDGSDDTLQQIRKDPPGVVILCAALDHGDARTLAGAVRACSPATGLVLVGEESGPVRNALDALDFNVDRFVGRPLAAKALRFAVRSATRAREAAPLTDELSIRLAAATDTAIDAFVRDAMDALPEAEADAGRDAAGGSPAPVLVLEPPSASPPELPRQREPTLILSDGGVSAAQAVPVSAAPEDPTAPQPVPPSSDLARDLRQKMSQMAERLFPGRPNAAAGALQMDAHAEIDLTSIGADSPEREDADPASGADTFADAAFATPDPSRSLHAGGAASKQDLRGEIELDSDRRSDTGEVTTGAGTGATTHRRRASALGSQRGNISPREEDLASLMARLARGAFTGRMILRRAEAEKVIHFDEGRPVFATSNLPHDRMGDLLYREGKITRAQHSRSREVVAESGRRMGEILVDMGFLKRRELLPAVRRHIEDIIYSVFSWDSGEYACVAGDAAPGEKIRLSRHPAALIVEGVRRKYGLDLLEARLGGAEAVVVVSDRDKLSALLREVDLGQAERRAIHHLDGENSLRRISEAADVDLLGVCQIGFALVVLGVAETASTVADTGVWGRERSSSLVGATDLAIDRERVLAKHALVDEADYFMLLGVRREASTFEIQRAYEAARRDFSDDAFPYELRTELSGEIEDINGLLDEAHTVLRDDALREAYKAHLLD